MLREDGRQNKEGTDEKEAVDTLHGTVGESRMTSGCLGHCVGLHTLVALAECVLLLCRLGDAHPGSVGSDHYPMVITACNDEARGNGADARRSSPPACGQCHGWKMRS